MFVSHVGFEEETCKLFLSPAALLHQVVVPHPHPVLKGWLPPRQLVVAGNEETSVELFEVVPILLQSKKH